MNRTLVLLSLLSLAGCAAQQKVAVPDHPAATAPVAQAPKPPPAPAAPAPVAHEQATHFNGALIHFGFNDSDLTPDSLDTLRSLAETMRAQDRLQVEIAGHADERGTTEYNLALGNRRADAARSYLVKLGVPEDRISIISYGEERPLDSDRTEEAWAKNRRDEIAPKN